MWPLHAMSDERDRHALPTVVSVEGCDQIDTGPQRGPPFVFRFGCRALNIGIRGNRSPCVILGVTRAIQPGAYRGAHQKTEVYLT